MSTTVLFDAPGPRARRRHRILTVIGAVAILALLFLIYRGLANPENNQFAPEKWAPFADPVTWTAYLLPGLLNTLKAAAVAVVLSLVVGLLFGVGRLSSITPIRVLCGALVEFFRSVPVLIMMLFVYYFCIYVLGVLGDASTFIGVVGGLTLYNSAVIAELIRSGVHSLPRGQGEAALALGMTRGQALSLVLLPQAVTAMLPSLISQLVVILKDTALGYIISYSELLRGGQTMATLYGNLIPALMVMAAIFILINYSLTLLARTVERRLQRSSKGPAPLDPNDTGMIAAAPTPAGEVTPPTR